MAVPNFPQGTNVICAAITMNSVLDKANMYHKMNSILQNEAPLFFQRSMVDATAITNQSDQSVEGYVAQQPRETLTSVIVEGNGSVEPNVEKLEHASLENLYATGRHVTTEITAVHEEMDRKATTKNQKSTVGEAST